MSFLVDSHVVTLAVPSLGFRRGVYQLRARPAVATVVHTTGAGPYRRMTHKRFARWRRRTGIENSFLASLWIYGVAMKAGPNYVVGQLEGQAAQVCPEDLCSWHVGGRGGRAYRRDWDRWAHKAPWWPDAWPGMASPRDLGGGQLWTPYGQATSVRVALSSLSGSVNANTYSIEVVPPDGDPRGPWSDWAWSTVCNLILDIHARQNIIVAQDTVVTHSDAHPLARTARGQPWDTDTRQFSWAEFERRVFT